MGRHAFDAPPGYAAYVVSNDWQLAHAVAGVDEGWNIPAALWDVRGGFDVCAKPGEVDHHSAKWRHRGAQVHARAGRGSVQSDPMAGPVLCLQSRGSAARYWADGDLHCAHLYWSDAMVRDVAVAMFGERADCDDVLIEDGFFFSDQGLRAFACDYLARALSPERPTALEMDTRGHAFVARLVRRFSARGGALQKRRRPDVLSSRQLAQVLDLLSCDLSEPPTLIELARAAGLTPYHFCRAFRSSVGVPPHRWLLHTRMERAKDYLQHKRWSIGDVAAAVGFDDPSYFARAFKRMTGLQPKAYRNLTGYILPSSETP